MKDFHVKEWVQTHAETVSEWVKTHKPHTAGIITATVVAIALIVATASGAFAPAKHVADHSAEPTANYASDADKAKTAVNNGDTTLKGDAGKEVLDKAETNAEANPNVTEATTEKAEEKSNADTAKSSGSSNASQPKGSGNNGASKTTQAPAKSNSNTSSGSSNKPAKKPKKWVPEQGHYEDVTEQVWVSNWVEEPVYETKQIITGVKYIFPEDGYVAIGDDAGEAHGLELWKKGYIGNYHNEPIYETQTVQTGTKKVDKGGYQTKVTGKKWVVDVPGHYE